MESSFIVGDLDITCGPVTKGRLRKGEVCCSWGGRQHPDCSARHSGLCPSLTFVLCLSHVELRSQSENLTPLLLWSTLSLSLVSLVAMVASLDKAIVFSDLI